ncbi:RraA family protein [Budvicia aquatica]|uniref:RraA family protein n=1 Tax=Budvicia aquatica TaxID=82979 RepID=UPI002088CD58|nr:RraA family protein [Budvicia aquatica]GKX51910.1 methyltransferase [Budvicia aquatica]
MHNTGFQIKRFFERPKKKLIEEFRELPSANIGDGINRQFCINNKIRPLNHHKLVGPALTVNLRTCDNLLLYKAIDMALPGDIIVVNGQSGDNNALMGELMLRWAERKKVSGFIINGFIRDLDFLEKSSIPIYALGATPAGPFKDGPGEINFPIAIENVVINPGDIVIGDHDGIVVVRQNDIENTLKKARLITEKEKEIKYLIDNDEWSMSWVDKKLNDNGCLYL